MSLILELPSALSAETTNPPIRLTQNAYFDLIVIFVVFVALIIIAWLIQSFRVKSLRDLWTANSDWIEIILIIVIFFILLLINRN